MSKGYVSLKQAIEITGISEPTLRRLAKKASYEEKKVIKGKIYFLDSFLYQKYPAQHTGELLNTSATSDRIDTFDRVDRIDRVDRVKKPNKSKGASKNDRIDRVDTFDRIDRVEKDSNTESHTFDTERLLADKTDQIHYLRQQLATKDKQIEDLMEANLTISERLRESNINLQTLQQSIKQLQISSLEPLQSKKTDIQAKIPTVDKILIGIAGIVSIALLLFFAMMLLAYLNR